MTWTGRAKRKPDAKRKRGSAQPQDAKRKRGSAQPQERASQNNEPDAKKTVTTAIYPGSFDPLTFGHVDIIERSARLFDKVIVSLLPTSQKVPLFTVDERIAI